MVHDTHIICTALSDAGHCGLCPSARALSKASMRSPSGISGRTWRPGCGRFRRAFKGVWGELLRPTVTCLGTTIQTHRFEMWFCSRHMKASWSGPSLSGSAASGRRFGAEASKLRAPNEQLLWPETEQHQVRLA